MNPSAAGWLKKCLHFTLESDILSQSEDDFYKALRTCGFIYGSSQTSIIPLQNTLNYTQQELAKINLLISLFYVDYQHHGKALGEGTLLRLIHFYESFYSQKQLFSSVFKLKTNLERNIEVLIHKRVQTNDSLVQKNFSHIITNALLFTDVLAFQKYIHHSESPSAYAKATEQLIMSTVYNALAQKTPTSTYDELILKLLKKSMRYSGFSKETSTEIPQLDSGHGLDNLEKYYLVDLTCMAIYSDKKIELQELDFLNALGQKLGLKASQIKYAIYFLHEFIIQHKKDISYFHFTNPLDHFYKKSQRSVKLLLMRNKKRLGKEIHQSKELMNLLSQSTHRELTADEKGKVKEQLFDIFKTIPSLAIFVLPGGSVLLPIIIKYIPQLLPSSFNENYDKYE